MSEVEYVPAERIVHHGLAMSMLDTAGNVINGVVHAVVLDDAQKPKAVLLTTSDGSVKTMYLKGVELHKHWTVH